MPSVHRIARVSISTQSAAPLHGIFEIDTADTTISFELHEEIAHTICEHLERFLTQKQPVARVVRLHQQ
jgi:hypothetical protein